MFSKPLALLSFAAYASATTPALVKAEWDKFAALDTTPELKAETAAMQAVPGYSTLSDAAKLKYALKYKETRTNSAGICAGINGPAIKIFEPYSKYLSYSVEHSCTGNPMLFEEMIKIKAFDNTDPSKEVLILAEATLNYYKRKLSDLYQNNVISGVITAKEGTDLAIIDTAEATAAKFAPDFKNPPPASDFTGLFDLSMSYYFIADQYAWRSLQLAVCTSGKFMAKEHAMCKQNQYIREQLIADRTGVTKPDLYWGSGNLSARAARANEW